MMENRFGQNVRNELTSKGHKIEVKGTFSSAMGGGQAVVRDSSAGVNYGASDPGRMAKRWRNCRLNRLRTGLGRKRGLSDDAKEFPLGQLVELYWTLSPRLDGRPVCKSL